MFSNKCNSYICILLYIYCTKIKKSCKWEMSKWNETRPSLSKKKICCQTL